MFDILKSITMRAFIIALIVSSAICTVNGQTQQKIEIHQSDSSALVEITTIKDGITKIERLEGDAALAYIESKDDDFINLKINKHQLKQVETQLNEIGAEIDLLMQEIELEIDSVIKKADREIKTKIICED